MYPSPEVEPHSEKDDDSSRSEKDMAAEGLCSLGKTVSGPSKSWSKVDVKKRKVRELSESDEDVEEDVPDISPVKRTTRELGKDVVEVKEVMDLIKNVGLMKTVARLSQCYEGLVKEFIVNIPEDIADKNIKGFCKVFVRGKCITFSPNVINKFLGRSIEGAGELEATGNEVCREITARQVKEWPSKKHLPVGKLIVKYDIFHKIGSANWHASTNALKLPIAFPSMICGIILSQHPGILSTNDLPSRRKPALSIHYKLFEDSHVEDIIITSAMKKPTSKGGLIVELKEMCKELGAGIRVATTRKESLESLIVSLERVEGENIEQAKEAEAQTSNKSSVTNDETSGNFVSDADEATSSSSSD
ncbi:uncharacterized protein LOC127122644 [Lathyrus oleraceus]|uniref:uncharacterized protein LOC127122644 n=1 Tax=Pisum sativum TaxID=3888 RepID=UPI0021CE36CE|nr:uncharacterized protein LOC127122644 [Pisum sativum]